MALERTIKIKVDSGGAERKVDKLDGSMRGLGSAADKTNQSFGKLKTTVIAVAAALQIRVVAQYADAFTSLQNQIRQTTTTTEQLTKRTATLLEVANRSRAGFTETADLYTQLTLSTENLNLSTEEQIRLTETISKSFAISGKSAAESAGAIRQLGQAFGSGALRGDEFNSIAEGAPELMRALQRSLGLTAGELREFAATGGITAEIMVTAFSQAAGVIDEKMINSVETLAQSMVIAESNAIAFVGASDLVTTSMGNAGESIVFLSENLDSIANVLLVAAITGFSKLTAGVILNTIETVKNTAAKLASVPVTKAVNTGVNFTTKNIVAQTTAMRLSTLAATGLRGALAFLGGPLGVALIAASAIAVFATSAEDAKSPTEKLAEEVETLAASFSKLNRGQLDAKIRNAVTEVNRLDSAILAARKSGEELGFSGIGKEEEKLVKLRKEALLLRDALFDAGVAFNLRGATDQSGLTGKPKVEKQDDPFINNERFKTASLKAELNERLAVQRAFNDTAISLFASTADQERAITEFNRLADLAALETAKTDAALDFEQRREALLTNDKLTSEARLVLGAELELQELDQKRIFELEKTDIERTAAEDRKLIAKDESDTKIEMDIQAAKQLANINRQTNGMIIAFGAALLKDKIKSKKAQIAIDAGASASEVWMQIEVAKAHVAAQLGIAAAPFIAALETQRGVSLGIIAANSVLKLGSSGGGGGGGGGGSFPGGGAQQSQAQRQDPIQQTNVLEFRGLAEVAAALENLDPGEQIPVEFAQRIVAGIAEAERFGGES